MFIKNYSDTDLVINYRNNSYTLESKAVTYVDDSWISLAMLKAMFGDYIEEVDHDTPIEEFLFDNQIEIELDTIYLIRAKGPGSPRLFIKGGAVDIYFSDGKVVPQSESDMSLFNDFTNKEGLMAMDIIPKWTLIKAHTQGSTPTVIFTNIEAIEEQ